MRRRMPLLGGSLLVRCLVATMCMCISASLFFGLTGCQSARSTSIPDEPISKASTVPSEAPDAPQTKPRLSTREDVDRHFNLALDRLDTGNLKEAANLLEETIQAAPQRLEARYNLAVIHELQGNFSSAMAHYQAILAQDPSHYFAAMNLANALVRSPGGLNEAMEQLSSLHQKHPGQATLLNALNHLRILDSRFEEVIRSSKDILRNKEHNVPALVNMAISNFHLQKLELAKAILSRAIDLSPDQANAHHYLGMVHLRSDDTQGAIASFQEAVRIQSMFPEAHNNLGVLYLNAGDFEGAAEHFRLAIQANPQSYNAFLNLANAFRGQQQFADSEAAYRKAIELNPKLADAYFNLGILLLDARTEGGDLIKQYGDAIDALVQYERIMGPNLGREDPVAKYIDEARKRIEVQRQRQEQARGAPRTVSPQPEDHEDGDSPDEDEAPEE